MFLPVDRPEISRFRSALSGLHSAAATTSYGAVEPAIYPAPGSGEAGDRQNSTARRPVVGCRTLLQEHEQVMIQECGLFSVLLTFRTPAHASNRAGGDKDAR